MIEREVLDRIPRAPGVYLFRSGEGEILYIGKANLLRDRVRSYFRADPGRGIRIQELARRALKVDTIVVGSETEALILEANLVREHRPPFNIQLKDDKRFPFVKVTLQEAFPRVLVTRRLDRDGARFFGPFISVGAVRQAVDLAKRTYLSRSCSYDLLREKPSRPCLDFHIGRCRAPCVGLQTEAEYGEGVRKIVQILEGDIGEFEAIIEEKMERAAAELRFEEAAGYRDALVGLRAIAEDQRVERAGGGDRDILGVARDGRFGAAVLLRIRKGVLIGRESHGFTDLGEESEAELLQVFANQHYLFGQTGGDGDLPEEILLPEPFPDQEALEEILSARRGRRIHLRVPSRGDMRRLTELAAANARHLLEDRFTPLGGGSRAESVLYELQDRLEIKVVPRLIICFDISHTQGSELVAAVTAFENGEPRKALYRRMKIKGDWRNDDFRSMAEAVERYLRRALSEELPLPNLIVLDGGKGQLSAVVPVVREMGLSDIAIVALAKRDEELFLPGRSDPLRLSRRDPALRLLQRIRNEAHRFAIGYNRKLRGRRTLTSELGGVPGIGPERQRALLTRFGSVKGVRAAEASEIARLPGFSKALAERLQARLGSGSGGEMTPPPLPDGPDST